MNLSPFFAFSGLAYVLTVAIGIWLSQKGKPYHAALFNIHKLLALAGVVLIGIHFSNLYKSGIFPSILNLAVATLASLVVILFVTGALMSLEKLNYRILRLLHQIVPTLLILVGLWMVYFI